MRNISQIIKFMSYDRKKKVKVTLIYKVILTEYAWRKRRCWT